MKNFPEKLLVVLLIVASHQISFGQDESIRPPGARIHVPDAGLVRKIPLKPAEDDRLVAEAKGRDKKIFYLNHNGRPGQIVVYQDGLIEVFFTEILRLENSERLRESFPDLYMHYKAFPKTTRGDWGVRLTVEIEKKFRATTPKELKKKSSQAYQLFVQHTRAVKPMITVTPKIIIQDE